MDIVFALFIAVNIITFFVYGADKRKAKKGKWRISEKTLLLMGFFGGSVGQLAAMKTFHHKTHKWYFWAVGVLSLILHIAILFVYFTKLKIL